MSEPRYVISGRVPRRTLAILIPEPHLESFPTDRDDWIQGVTEAALGGVRAWMMGAGLTTEPVLELVEPTDSGEAS